MSLAVGIDLQPIGEVEDSLRAFGERYTRLLYTSAELSGLSRDPRVAARDLAATFAAKEAVMKVLAPSDDIPSWLDIEVGNVEGSSASIALHGVAAQLAFRQGVSNVTVRLGVAGDCAAATAIAQKSNSGVTRSR
jgi:holo-[acyl-carrier protein] synthase